MALVGFGAWGKNYVSAVRETGLAQITAVLIRDKAKIDANQWSDLTFTEKIDQIDCDAVIVATHPAGCVTYAEHFLRRQIPVMIEKPAGLSLADAVKLEKLSHQNPVPILISHQHLFSSVYQELRKRVLHETLIKIETQSGKEGPFRDYSFVWDYAPHDISMILGLKQSSQEVHVTSAEISNKMVGECRASLSFDLGVDAKIHIWNNRLPKARKLTVETTNGLYMYDDNIAPDNLIVNGVRQKVKYEKPLTASVWAFLGAVQEFGTADYRFGAKWAVSVAKVIEDIMSKAGQHQR